MLKITNVVKQSSANMAGCGKQDDWNCGINVKWG